VLTGGLGEDPARLQRIGDLADPGAERTRAQRHPAVLGEVPHAVERVRQLLRELGTDLVPVPEQSTEILHPLEVRHRDPARVREHVGQNGDPALPEDGVRLERGRTIGPLGDHARPHARRVVRRQLILAGSEHEDVAVELQQLVVREPRPGGAPLERSVLLRVGVQLGDVQPGG
jgi:hypothetical protein